MCCGILLPDGSSESNCPNRRVRILSEGFGCSSEINDYKRVRIGHFYRFPSSDSDDDSDVVGFGGGWILVFER